MSMRRSGAGLLWLSLGRLVGRSASVAVQGGAALFLTPEALGAWATASSTLAPVLSLKNRGASNAALRSSTTVALWCRELRTWNAALVGIGALTVAVAHWLGFLSSVELAIGLALSPIVIARGRADWREVGGMRMRAEKEISRAYWIAGIAQVVIGLTVAWATRSVWAVVIATWTAPAVLWATLPQLDTSDAKPVPRSELDAIRWSAPSLVFASTLAAKADYLTGAMLLPRADLGRYFLAYQASVGLSGLAMVPLSRLFILHGDEEGGNESLLRRAAGGAFAIAPVAAGLGLMVGLVLPTFAGPEWRSPWVFTVLFASTPFRMLGELVVASDQRAKDWRRSAMDKWIDAVGTALSAVVAVVLIAETVVALATAIAVWKSLFALTRLALRVSASSDAQR